MDVGDRIRKRRKELGFTQSELAQRLGLTSKAAISTVENNKEDMTTERIRKYAKALETTPGYLMGWTEDPKMEVINVQPIIDAFEGEIAKIIDIPNFPDKINEYAKKIIDLSEEDQKTVFQYIDFLLEKGGQTS